MRTLLGMLMVAVALGDGQTITGISEDSVLLPCNCSERDLDTEFKWQMDEPNRFLVFKCNKTTSHFGSRYKGRVKTFLNVSHNNCSILLTNITANDTGKYKCIFNRHNQYQNPSVTLNISARTDDPRTEKMDATKEPHPVNPERIVRYIKIIPIMLVLGLSLVLWRRWKLSQRQQTMWEVKTNNSNVTM